MNAPTTASVANDGDARSDLERRYPHIVAGLVAVWPHEEAAVDYLGSLLVDDRDDRAGLPAEVFEELLLLSELSWQRRRFNAAGHEMGVPGGGLPRP